MAYADLVEIVAAAHLGHYVTSPYGSRGGLLLVAPPGALKSTAIDVLDAYPDAKVLSDINVQSLIKLRDDIVSGDIQTLAFSDLEKLYKRHAAVASNVEGILMALIEEGFRKASFQDQRTVVVPARCTVVAGVTSSSYERHISDWVDSGFARRFLIVHYRLENSWRLEEAISNWTKHEFGNFQARLPTNRVIPYGVLPGDKIQIDRCLKYQRSRLAPRIVLGRIVSVIRWKHTPADAERILRGLYAMLGPQGGTVQL